MRQSIASIWVIALVITFILIFSAFIIITINYNKVFKAKNTVVTIIEKNNGMTNIAATCGKESAIDGKYNGHICTGAGALQTINLYLLGLIKHERVSDLIVKELNGVNDETADNIVLLFRL